MAVLKTAQIHSCPSVAARKRANTTLNWPFSEAKHLPVCLGLRLRYRVEDGCTKGVFEMFQVKGENSFKKPLQTQIDFLGKKLSKNCENVFVGGFYTIGLLNFI